MMAMMVVGIVPKELTFWVIELLGADPVMWLLPGYELRKNNRKKGVMENC